ncbi:MAG: VirB4 family type IV secretion system protein [Candidatus Dormibacteria bacterium]
MSQEPALRVPLAVDAQLRVPVGPFALPVRAVLAGAALAPLAWLVLGADLPGLWGPGAAAFLLAVGAVLGLPEREGVWVGTHAIYGLAQRILPSVIRDGVVGRGVVAPLGDAVVAEGDVAAGAWVGRWLVRCRRGALDVPRIVGVDAGVVSVGTGTHVAMLAVEGPAQSPDSDQYLAWCGSFVAWLGALECPARLVTRLARQDPRRAGSAFDDRVRAWPATRLREFERELVVELAARTTSLRHHVIVEPGGAGADGIPRRSRPWLRRPAGCDASSAERALRHGLRIAPSFGIAARPMDGDDVAALELESSSLCRDAAAGNGVLQCASRHVAVVAVTALPPAVETGALVEVLLSARVHGVVVVDLAPVAAGTAQRHLQRRVAALRHAARRGVDAVEAEVALQDAVDAVAALAARELQPVRLAITAGLVEETPADAAAAAQRLLATLAGRGFRSTRVTRPGFLPLVATSGVGQPLSRSLVLTTAAVAARLVPCLGTPFSDVSQPLIGVNRITGAAVHHSVWTAANHNLVVVGSSGAGKSVSVKTLLVRHILGGAVAAVIDPDSEYLPVMRCVGGDHVELGEDALNPLAVAEHAGADEAASLILPVLALMGGDERGVAAGRVVRRLPDEDQGWLHECLVGFLRRAESRGQVPLLSDLVAWLAVHRHATALSPSEQERVRVVGARLRRFTQGARAAVFDRPSSFQTGDRPVSIGMKRFAMAYGADLTPALAVVLTHLLVTLRRARRHLVVVVDEAHRVTSDPDAGEVLGQLVRQARKHGCGVWMATQRVEDFVGTDLGRTLAATAASKLVLGTEEAAAPAVRDAFQLSDLEVRSICPMQRGTGVLISGAERAVVDVVAGPALLAVAATSPGAGVA